MLRQHSGRLARRLLLGTLRSTAGPASSVLVSNEAGYLGEHCHPKRASEPMRDAIQGGRRFFSDRVDCCNPTGMPEAEYNKIADACIDELGEKIEEFLEDAGVDPYDVESSMGVLTVKLGDKGTFVVNKQTPNRQIWLSSPVSGPFRYDPVDGRWVYSRDSHSLHDRLKDEISGLIGQTLEL